MPYANRDDLVSRYTEEEIAALESIGLDAPDAGRTASALSDAEEDINSLIAIRYTLPLPSVPAPLKSAVCDVARFKLYKDRATDEVKYRYERAMKWALLVSEDRAKLIFDSSLTSPEIVAEISNPLNPVAAAFTGAVFSDQMLDKMVDVNRVAVGLGRGGWR